MMTMDDATRAKIAAGLDQAIHEAVGIPVERWSPLDDVKVDEARFDVNAVSRLSSVTSLAAALAMKQDIH